MSKSVKKIVKNSFFQTFGSFGGTGLNFILVLSYARLLGPERFGSLNTSQNQVILWSMFVDLGLSNGLIGALTAAGAEKQELSRQGFRSRDLVARVLFLRLGGAAVGACSVALLSWLHAGGRGEFLWSQFWQDMAFVPFLFALALQQTAMAYSNFRERQGLAVLSLLLGIFITVVAALFLAWQKFSIAWLLLAQSWGGFLSASIVFGYFALERKSHNATKIPRVEKNRNGPWGREAWRVLWRDAWPYAITFAAAVFWQRLDLIVTSRLLGSEAAGQYALAVKLVSIPVLVASAVSFAIFPDLQRVGRDAPEKILHYLGTISKFLCRYGAFFVGALLLGVAVVIEPLLPKYGPALKLLVWFIPGVWAFWIHSFLVNALFGLRRYKMVVSAHLYALLAYVAILPVAAKFFGLPGVALGYDAFCVALLISCLIKLRDKGLLGRRFSLFGRFTSEETVILRQLRERLLP